MYARVCGLYTEYKLVLSLSSDAEDLSSGAEDLSSGAELFDTSYPLELYTVPMGAKLVLTLEPQLDTLS